MPEQYFEVNLLKPARQMLEERCAKIGFGKKYLFDDFPNSTPIITYQQEVRDDLRSSPYEISQELLSYGRHGLFFHSNGLEQLEPGRQELFLETLASIPVIRRAGIVEKIREEYNIK